MIKNGKKYLITTDDWFYGPDGESYHSVWGTCRVKNIKEVFKFDPLRPSTNWYVEVGKGDTAMIIAGCRIHYAVGSPKRPKDPMQGKTYVDKDNKLEYSGCKIYMAE